MDVNRVICILLRGDAEVAQMKLDPVLETQHLTLSDHQLKFMLIYLNLNK